MKACRMVLLAGCFAVVGGAGRIQAAEEKAVCQAEVSQASAMVARARAVMKGGEQKGTQLAQAPSKDPASGPAASPQLSPGTGTGGGRTPQGDAASGAGRAPEAQPGAGSPRGLAASASSEISPWNPHPGDRTLMARTSKAQKLTDQAQRFCKAGKMDEAKAKAAEAITVLDPK